MQLKYSNLPIKIFTKEIQQSLKNNPNQCIPVLIGRPYILWRKEYIKIKGKFKELVLAHAQYRGNALFFTDTDISILQLINGVNSVDQILHKISTTTRTEDASKEVWTTIQMMEERAILGWQVEDTVYLHVFFKPYKTYAGYQKQGFYEKMLRKLPSGHINTPVAVQLIITTKCHSSCIFCFENIGKLWNTGRFKEMNENQLELEDQLKLIKKLDKLGVLEISISGGEPTIVPELLFEIMQECNKRKIGCSIVSNGYEFADHHFAEDYVRITRKGIDGSDIIQISCESTDATLQRYLRPGVSLKKIEDAVHNLKDLGLKPYLCSVMNKLNFHEMEKLTNYSKELGCIQWRTEDVRPIGAALGRIRELLLTPKQMAEMYAYILKKKIEYQGSDFYENDGAASIPRNVDFTVNDYRPPPYLCPYEKIRNKKRRCWGCGAAERNLTIAPDGTVIPCGYLLAYPEQWGGNIRNKDIMDLWKHDKVLKR